MIRNELVRLRSFANPVRQFVKFFIHQIKRPITNMIEVIASRFNREKCDGLSDLRAWISPFETRGEGALIVVCVLEFEQVHPIAVNR